jgi:transketolase
MEPHTNNSRNGGQRIAPGDLAKCIRQNCVKMHGAANSSHIGSALSIADVIAVLYSSVLRYDASRPDWPDRDRFILSKGHGCTALYGALSQCGFFPPELLDTYYQNGTSLPGHATHKYVPGIEVSTGSLGHGLPLSTGMALVGKRDGRPYRVFCALSEGDCDEGSTWEAALFAAHHHLDNLTAIVDYNKIQSFGRVKDVLDLDPLADKWKAFGWATREIDGHDLAQITQALRQAPYESGRPTCIVAHTVKGKGIAFMEDKLEWHYRAPKGDLLEVALKALEQGE